MVSSAGLPTPIEPEMGKVDVLGDALRVPGPGRAGVGAGVPSAGGVVGGGGGSGASGGGVSGISGVSSGGEVSGGGGGGGVRELRARGGAGGGAAGSRRAGGPGPGPRQPEEDEDESEDDEDEDEGWDDGGEVAKALAGKVSVNGGAVAAAGGNFGVQAALQVVQVGLSVLRSVGL